MSEREMQRLHDDKHVAANDPPNHTVTYLGRVGITATYRGPTNTKGSRWMVCRSDGKYNEDPDRLTVPYESGLSTGDNVAAAITAYLDRKQERDEHHEGWPGDFVISALANDVYVAAWVGAVGSVPVGSVLS
jgi:hypothetical protein